MFSFSFLFIYLFIYFLLVVNFVTHWNEKALGSHIHLSVKSAGLLLPFVNIAMIDTVCKDFFDILLWILGLYTQEWDYWVDSSSIVNFLRHLHTVSLVTVPFYVSIHSTQMFQLLHIFANSDYFVCLFVCLFDSGHPYGCEKTSRGFDLHLFDD